MLAAAFNHLDCVKELIEEAQMQDENGWTALMWAAYNGHLEVVAELAKYELHIKNTKGETALMKATQKSQTECAKALLEESKEQNIDGLTGLMMASISGNTEMVEILKGTETHIVSNAKQTALINAAANNNLEAVKLLLEEAKMQDEDGWTALMWAARRGHAQVVELLVQHEARVANQLGETALMIAVRSNHPECV